MSLLAKVDIAKDNDFLKTGKTRDELIARVRRQILTGTYDTDYKLDVCIEKLLQSFQTTSSESDAV